MSKKEDLCTEIEEVLDQKLSFLPKLSTADLQELQQAIGKQLNQKQVIEPSVDKSPEDKLIRLSEEDRHLMVRSLMVMPDDACNDLGVRLVLSPGMEDVEKKLRQSIHLGRSIELDTWLQFPEQLFIKFGAYRNSVREFNGQLTAILKYVGRLPKTHPLVAEAQKVTGFDSILGLGALNLEGIERFPNVSALDLTGVNADNIYSLILLPHLSRLQSSYSSLPVKPPKVRIQTRIEIRKYQDKILRKLNKEPEADFKKVRTGVAALYPRGIFPKKTTDDSEGSKRQIRQLLSSSNTEDIEMAVVLMNSLGDEGIFSEVLSDAGIVSNNKIIGRYFSIPHPFYAYYRVLSAIPEEYYEEYWCSKSWFFSSFSFHDWRFRKYDVDQMLDNCHWIKHLEIQAQELTDLPYMEGVEVLTVRLGTGWKAPRSTFNCEWLLNMPDLRVLHFSKSERVTVTNRHALQQLSALKVINGL